jgi:LPXTG-motif cell wall-anchored protein
MKKIHYNNKLFFTILCICITINGTIIPTVFADPQPLSPNAFEKGVSWQPMIPLKRTTFVNFDPTSFLDDYSYLASVPTAVFYNAEQKCIFSNPLLFYEDEQNLEENQQTLNARQGIDYFMADWMSYCEGTLDHMTLINTPRQHLNSTWQAKNYTIINSNSSYEIANSLALQDWSYTDNAVVAVINETFQKPENTTTGSLQGTVNPERGILTEHFKIPQTNQQYPIYNEFTIPDGYKFLTVRSWYPCFYFSAGIPGFEGIFNMSIPAGDRDMQIYCEYNGQWMMTGITDAWNAKGGMDLDKTSCYVYKSGKWSVAITDVPTKSLYTDLLTKDTSQLIDTTLEPQKHHKIFTFEFGRYGKILDIIKNMRKVTYQVDVNIYPGVMIEIPQTPPFSCRNAKFSITWNNPSVALGLSLIGPSGEEVLSSREPGVSSTTSSEDHKEQIAFPEGTTNDLSVERLGECLPGEHYSVCVFAMNELSSPADFTLTYSWDQNISKIEGDCLASATEGAVLASILNAPLLYTSLNAVPQTTLNTLNKLGVKKIFLIDLGGHLTSNAQNQLTSVAPFKHHFIRYDSIYSYIQNITQRNDVIFSTIDSWSYWYVSNFSVAGEMLDALPIGPAAYIAAQHGSPVLLIDNHPEFSAAVVWHDEFWRRHPDGVSKLPTVSEMYLTGTRVYSFLKAHHFDLEGDEIIITVADQFEIGLSWDRMFVGKGEPGRFIGSPIDLSVWIAKNVFYPQIVFQNPALKNPDGVVLINGSSSKRAGLLGLFTLWRGKLGLKITKPSQEETFQYPVLDTLICYDHKFNSRASAYWGFTYECADGTIPGQTSSEEPIDDGVMLAVNGKEGAFLPDLSGSDVQPFYLRRAGYDPVFSTNFDANMHNLNQGVLLWMINTHGAPVNGGMLMFWDVTGDNSNGYPPIPLAGYKKETNPWRGYEWLMGSTDEPDTLTMEIHGILPALAGNPDPRGLRIFTTALDWALAKRPLRDAIGKIASLPGLRLITPEWLQNTQDYYDGIIITVLLGRFGTSWYNGTQVDDSLGNIHSTGISSVACLPAGKYLQLTLMRHGSVFQIMDPWATSWYSDVWQNAVPRGIALGKTIGEIYSEGIQKVGILYISEPPQWWWDLAENVCLYGDPNLRIWVPNNDYNDMNHWELSDVQPLRYDASIGFSIDGHMPFGVDQYPHAQTSSFSWESSFIYLVLIGIVLIVLLGVYFWKRKK